MAGPKNKLYPGVALTTSGKYSARTIIGGARNYLGSYDTPEEAHEAYLKKKSELEKDKKLKTVIKQLTKKDRHGLKGTPWFGL